MKVKASELKRGDVVRLPDVGDVQLGAVDVQAVAGVLAREDRNVVRLEWAGMHGDTVPGELLVERLREANAPPLWQRVVCCKRCATVASRKERRAARLEAWMGSDGVELRCTQHGLVVVITPDFLLATMDGDPPPCGHCGEVHCSGRHGAN